MGTVRWHRLDRRYHLRVPLHLQGIKLLLQPVSVVLHGFEEVWRAQIMEAGGVGYLDSKMCGWEELGTSGAWLSLLTFVVHSLSLYINFVEPLLKSIDFTLHPSTIEEQDMDIENT